MTEFVFARSFEIVLCFAKYSECGLTKVAGVGLLWWIGVVISFLMAECMKVPAIRGLIDRRVLVNFRVDPDVLARVCPAPFRPQVVNGFGIAGICLIRLERIRPKFWPSFLGIASENAAHRIAVTWGAEVGSQTGVFIPRRDTSSRLNAFAGGRLFPGVHHLARFDVDETDSEYQIQMTADDEAAHLRVHGHVAKELPPDSIFDSLSDCSRFFEEGSRGYSPTETPDQYDGLELRSGNWRVQPLAVNDVQSSFFDDMETFPVGSVTFDNALLMTGIDHEWHSLRQLCC